MESNNYQDLLKKPEAVAVFNLHNEFATLNDKLVFDSLSNPPEGVYEYNRLVPVLLFNKKLYPLKHLGDRNKLIKTFNDFINISNDDIVDDKGTVVLSKKIMFLKKKTFLDTPNIPVNGIKLLYFLITNYINKRCKYSRCGVSADLDLFKDDVNEEEIDLDYIIDSFSDLFMRVDNFISSDNKHIYFSKLIGTTLYIEKVVDYRIYMWEKNEYEKKERENEQSEDDVILRRIADIAMC